MTKVSYSPRTTVRRPRFTERDDRPATLANTKGRREWLSGIERCRGPAVLALALALYGAILAFKVLTPDPGDAVLLLLAVPIALLAIRFGRVGGAAASVFAILLLALSELLGATGHGALGYLTRALTFLTLGVMLGSFAEQLHQLRGEMEGRIADGLAASEAANVALTREVDARARAEKTLASERDFLAAVLESLDTGIVACDADGVLSLFNDATRKIHGLPERPLPAAQWAEHYDLFRADGKTPMRTEEIPLRRALAGERIRDVPMVIAPRGTEPRTFLASGQPIIDSSRHKQGAVVAMHDITDRLRAEVQLQTAIEEALTRLAQAVEYRDHETSDHVGRMSRYARVIAEAARLGPEHCADIEIASRMHDVGKLAVPDRVLRKPGKLNREEREQMQRHTLTGHALLAGSGNALLELAATIALTHHERVDGTGYPHGLAGDRIPLEGRIVALADVFDALTSDRVYRPGFSLEETLAVMAEGRGSQFDAELFDAFMEELPRLLEIGTEHPTAADNGKPPSPAARCHLKAR